MTKHSLPIAVWLLAAALMPADVSAQLVGADAPPPESMRRPYRGLFGSPGDPSTPQSLILSGSIFGAYDDNVQAGLTGSQSGNRRLQESGAYGGANAGLAYSLATSSERVTFGLSSAAAASAYRYDGDTELVPHGNVAANLRYSLAQRTSISVSQQVVYTEFYRHMLFPSLVDGGDDDGAAAGDPDVEIFDRSALRYNTAVGFSKGLGRRSSLRVGYHFNQVDYLGDEHQDWRNQGASIGYNQRLTANATLNLGYGYQVARNEGRDAREAHNVNAGVSYGRALSFSRRTSLSFSTGSAIFARDDLTEAGVDARTHFRLVGNATLNHELGRTWTAQAAYNRGFIFREGFDEPFFTDALSASIGGFVTRRLDFSAVARWSLATQNRPGRNQYDSLAASAQARYALSQFFALFARYIYYQYEFEGIVLDPDLPRALDRQGVRVGLTASFPLIR